MGESLKSDANENEGEFQWYNSYGEMLKQGNCKFDNKGTIN